MLLLFFNYFSYYLVINCVFLYLYFRILKDSAQDDWMLFVGASLGETSVNVTSQYPILLLETEKKFCDNEDGLMFHKFIDEAKETGIEHVLRYRDDSVILSNEQKEILNLVSCQISCIKHGEGLSNFPQVVLVQGPAGSGKTVVIGDIECMVTEAFGMESVLIIAYTGSSALNANGRTIHSALRLYFDSKNKDCVDLKGESLKLFQDKMKNVKFLIIEEFSMVGTRMLNIINKRCMQMKSCNKPFGGLPLYMFGDLFQLCPIGDTPLYNMNVDPYKTTSYAGSILFKSLVRTKFLSVCHRQKDVQFLEFLDNLSCGVVTQKGQDYIKDRFEENMSVEEVESFNDALHLFQYLNDAFICNRRKLIELGKAITCIEAENNNSYARCSSDELAGNLQNMLEVAVGARVMLRSNLWTDGGLVNGCIGIVEEIVYCETMSSDKPSFILVKFENYYGPTLSNGCVPISRVLKSWNVNNIHCTRYQFPLTLSYAISVHKSQGLTLHRVVLHFDVCEMTAGLFYVAMSRVREKNHLMICGSAVNSPLFRINVLNYKSKVEGRNWLMSRGE